MPQKYQLTIFPFMLKFQKTNRYNLFTGIIIFLMVILTCIPPISARNIGIRSQYNRYVRHAMEKPYRGETTEDGVFVITNGNTKILEYHFRDTINAVGDDFYKNPLRVLKNITTIQ